MSQSLFLEGYLLFLILKFIWKCITYFPCCSLIVLSFGPEKKKFLILCHTWIFWSYWYWMNYTDLWEMRLGHFCLLWAIYVFFFFFLDTLSLVTQLSLLISLSFLKPLSIVFQDGIWSVCFNVVVLKRIQRRKKKKKKEEEKESVKKEENKKGSYQILRSEMEGRNTALKRRRGEKKKKMLNGNSKKSWHSDTSWKHFLYLPSPIFILFPLLLPYITS